jgi:hypothetical protein
MLTSINTREQEINLTLYFHIIPSTFFPYLSIPSPLHKTWEHSVSLCSFLFSLYANDTSSFLFSVFSFELSFSPLLSCWSIAVADSPRYQLPSHQVSFLSSFSRTVALSSFLPSSLQLSRLGLFKIFKLFKGY